MKLVFDDCLGIKDTVIDVIGVRYQLDDDNRPIDIVITSFNKEDLEHIADEFCEVGYNCREGDVWDLYSDTPDEIRIEVLNGKQLYMALYGRLTKFKVENPKGRVVYY